MNTWKRLILCALPGLWIVALLAVPKVALSGLLVAGCLLSGWFIWQVTGSASGQGRPEGGPR